MDRQNPLVGVNGASPSRPLKLSAPSKTDISRESADPFQPAIRFSSPLLRVSMPTSSFRRARMTFKAPKGYTQHWDQAGFIFVWPTPELPSPEAANPGTAATAPLFVKAGIENITGTPLVACVANSGELDFSALPLESGEEVAGFTLEVHKYGQRLAILMVRKGADGEDIKTPIRVVYWCLKEDSRRENMWVGVFSARPDWDGQAPGPLDIEITQFEVEDEHGTIQLA